MAALYVRHKQILPRGKLQTRTRSPMIDLSRGAHERTNLNPVCHLPDVCRRQT